MSTNRTRRRWTGWRRTSTGPSRVEPSQPDSWREEHEEFISKMMVPFDIGKADPLPSTPSPTRWVHLEAWGRWQWCTSALIIAR